jgi:hypothetical protein
MEPINSVEVKFHCLNDAFEGDAGAEIARVLRDAADRLEQGHPGNMTLRDLNGNPIGEIKLT